MSHDKTINAITILQTGPVIPVLVINDISHAVPLAGALLEGGVRVLEVTLRTSCALEAISQITRAFPDAITGAGTVINPRQFDQAADAGARFVISPGLTAPLLSHAVSSGIPFSGHQYRF